MHQLEKVLLMPDTMQTVGIIGLGYVGLPTAIGFHDAGFTVWGVDISQRTVDMVKRGENPTGDPDVDDIIPAPGTENWHITTSTAEAIPHCDVVLVTVPTPVTDDLKPDLTYVASAGRAQAALPDQPAAGPGGAGHSGHRLHKSLHGSVAGVCAGAVRGARHRWIRPLGYPRETAQVL